MATSNILIAGTSSGIGKTTLTLALLSALTKRGMSAQSFKVGPDYLDPTWHKLVTGRNSYNLDSWMTSDDYVRDLFEAKSSDADVSIIEGVMGLFDGASPVSNKGSSAEVAMTLGIPVLLICDAGGTSRSFAAMVKGFSEFEEGCRICGIIANHCGSENHAALLEEALEVEGLPPLLGWFQKESLPPLPSRHLGLRQAQKSIVSDKLLDQLAEICEAQVDLDEILRMSGSDKGKKARSATITAPTKRLGIARDDAFHFYYPDNLELLQEAGIEIVPFSPVNDRKLPEDLDALYIGGGYPEEFAKELSENTGMLEAIHGFADAGKVIYAECGGMMYLSRSLTDRQQNTWKMLGILPFHTRMLERLKHLGYTRSTLNYDCMFGTKETEIRGHEFHYSEIIDGSENQEWERPYTVVNSRGTNERLAGFLKGKIMASYIHQHFGSNPEMVRHFLAAC